MASEYLNNVRYVINEFIIPITQNNNIDQNNIKQMRQCITNFFTQYNGKTPDRVHDKMDSILQQELVLNNIYTSDSFNYGINLWKGDITELNVDVIVNAANAQGTGCYKVDHQCIDNVIYNKAGPRLREEMMARLNGQLIPTSGVVISKAYNLPANNIFHTVGPIVDKINKNHLIQLSNCYINCLNKVVDIKKHSIAFCCISTGVYKMPKDIAAQVAIRTIKQWIQTNKYSIKIIFCVYTEDDLQIYKKYLSLQFK